MENLSMLSSPIVPLSMTNSIYLDFAPLTFTVSKVEGEHARDRSVTWVMLACA
jgi:hypothetical protein